MAEQNLKEEVIGKYSNDTPQYVILNRDGTFVDHEGDSGKYEVKVRETDYSDDYVYFSYSTGQK